MVNLNRRQGTSVGGFVLPLLGLLAILSATSAEAATTIVTLDLEPRVIGLDEWAELSVKVEGGGTPSVPTIDGLRIEYAGRSSRLESINGHVRTTETFHLRVRPERVGDFRIDPSAFRVDSVTASGEPLGLRVVATPPPAASSVPSPTYEEPFLRLVAEHERPFVGELVPLRIEAWFPDDLRASLNSAPKSGSTAFTLETSDGEADLERRLHEGRVYNVLTWRAALVGVKEGQHALPVEVEATLQLPDRRPRRRAPRARMRPGSLLADDFFDDFFDDSLLDSFLGRTIQKPVTLRAELSDFEVRALPAEGRPAAFRGAVGRFDLHLGATPPTVAVGDPMPVEATVSGRGGFARVQAPGMDDDPAWKTYKAEATFDPADDLGAMGRKTFRQTLVARDPATNAVPPMSFAYFDPLEERYEVLRTGVRPIRVTGMAVTSDADVATPAPPAADFEEPHVRGLGAISHVPAVFRPQFQIAFLAAAIALVLGASLTLVRRRRELDPGRRARRRVARMLSEAGRDLDVAYQASDSPAFFAAARRLLQLRMGALWRVEPASITAAEVRHRRPEWSAAVETLEAADAVTFGGRAMTVAHLDAWKERVSHAQDAMEVAR